jgi:hypothetical protein
MKNLFKLDIKTIAVLILIGVVVFQFCGHKKTQQGETIKIDGKKYELLKHTIDTQYVPVTQTVTKKGKDIYHDTTIYVPIPTDKPIDTLSILKDFFAKNVYKDTLKLKDSLGYVTVTDTIQKNNILSRTWKSNVNKITIKELTIVKELPKTQVFWGFNGGFNKKDVVANLGTGLLVKTKTDKIYQVGLGISNSVNGSNGTTGTLSPYINGGIYWKIQLHK